MIFKELKSKFFQLLALSLLTFSAQAQYCATSFSGGSDTYAIDRVRFKGIDNTTNARSANGYGNFSAISTQVSCGEVITLTIDVGSTSTIRYSRVWIDWNDDKTFAGSEQINLVQTGTSAVWTATISVPPSGGGSVRMRINYCDDGYVGACYNGASSNYGEAEDYTIVIVPSVDMSVVGASVVQNNTNVVSRNATNQEMIGINVETTGCSTPWYVKSISFKDGDSDDLPRDASNAKLFYTGNSGSFATGNNVGSVAPNTTFTISGVDVNVPALGEGNNWFWLAYNIRGTAELDDYVDAEVDEIVLSNGTVNQTITPSNANPVGKRQIVNAYCAANHSDTYANDYIGKVTFGSINNSSARNTNGYSDFTGGTSETVASGTTKSLNVTGVLTSINLANLGEPYWLYAFFDWNRDGDFSDQNEKYLIGSVATSTIPTTAVTFDETFDVQIPGECTSGFSRMRICLFDSYVELHDACAPDFGRGEVEDYGINICGGAKVNSNTWFCAGDLASLVATDYGSSTIEWQMSDSVSTNWSAIGSGPTASQTASKTTFFRAELTNAGCPVAYSDVVSFSVPEVLSIKANPSAICKDDTTTIDITYNYQNVFQETIETAAIIPDGNAATQSSGEEFISIIDLTGAEILPNLNDYYSIDSVCLNITHTNLADLRAFLVHPTSGKSVLLFDEADLDGADLVNTCFGPMATNIVTSGTGSYTGLFLPTGRLDAFIGEENNSVWELHIQDMDGGTIGGTGTFDSWSMQLGHVRPSWSPQDSIVSSNADSTSIRVKPSSDTSYVVSLVGAACFIADSVLITVTEPVDPVVNINSALPGLTICQGDSITFTGSTDADPALNPIYAWYVNGAQAGSDSLSFGQRNLADGDTIVFETTVNYSCGVRSAKDTVYVNVVSDFMPSISIFSDANPDSVICDGSTVVFSVDTLFPGSSPTIEWFVNNAPVSSVDTFYTNMGTLINGDVVKVKLTVSETCAIINTVIDSLIMDVRPAYNPTLVLDVSPTASSYCLAETLQFTATITDPTPTGVLEWYINGVLTTETNTVWSTDTFSVGSHTVKAVYVTNEMCASAATIEQSYTFDILASFPLEVTIAADTLRACDGNSISLSVETLNNGGSAPTYQWRLNGSNVPGAIASTYSSSTFSSGDKIQLYVVSNSSCASPNAATSNLVEVEILANVTPFVTIEADATVICQNEEVIFTIDQSIGEGNNPSYEWFLNSDPTAVITGLSYATDTLRDGDQVFVTMTSDAVCTAQPTDDSGVITITVNDSVSPYFEIASDLDSICIGGTAIFTIENQNNVGATPIFEWFVNGVVFPGTSTSIQPSDLNGGDVISANIIVSGVNCLTNSGFDTTYVVEQYPELDATFITDSVDLFTYDFSNMANKATTWSWDFGDGTTSAVQNPQHEYANKGKYTVCLNLTDANTCTYMYCEELNVLGGVSVEELVAKIKLRAYPNPASNSITITADENLFGIYVRDAVGKLVTQIENTYSTAIELNTTNLSAGIYIIEVRSNGVLIPIRVSVNH